MLIDGIEDAQMRRSQRSHVADLGEQIPSELRECIVHQGRQVSRERPLRHLVKFL